MKTNHVVALAVATIAIGTSLSVGGAAHAPAAPGQRVAALKQNLEGGEKNLRKYERVETTTISLKGEQKSSKQQRVYYGADGTLTKLPIGEPPPQAAQSGGRRGRLKEEIVAHKKDEMQDYMERASNLIHRYVPPSPAQIQQAKDA